MCAFAPYDLENVRVVGFDVVSNRPKVAAYRAPGAPIAEFAAECVIDHSPPVPTRVEREAAVFTRDPGAGRPTKRDRRRLDQFRTR